MSHLGWKAPCNTWAGQPRFETSCPAEANLLSLNRLLVRLYDDQGVPASNRMKHLTMADLGGGGDSYPCLKHIKAAKVRAFSPVCVALCKMYQEDRHGKHRLAMVVALDKAYKILGKTWQEWDGEAKKDFQVAMCTFLSHYSWLAEDSMHAGRNLYSLVQKHHLLCHLSTTVGEYFHPSLAHTYGSESFMGIYVCAWGPLVPGGHQGTKCH